MKGRASASFKTAPLSSKECRNRSSSRHSCQSLATTALRKSRKASLWPVSSCSRLWRTMRYEPAVRSRCEVRHVYTKDNNNQQVTQTSTSSERNCFDVLQTTFLGPRRCRTDGASASFQFCVHIPPLRQGRRRNDPETR